MFPFHFIMCFITVYYVFLLRIFTCYYVCLFLFICFFYLHKSFIAPRGAVFPICMRHHLHLHASHSRQLFPPCIKPSLHLHFNYAKTHLLLFSTCLIKPFTTRLSLHFVLCPFSLSQIAHTSLSPQTHFYKTFNHSVTLLTYHYTPMPT